MATKELKTAKTLADLKKLGYESRTIKTELRQNLIEKLRSGDKVFKEILGFQNTVIPDIERAILSKHNILLLGLRGQAKTRIARLITQLLDEYIPVIKGSEINDDPFNPISKQGREIIASQGDKTEIEWVHRDARYVEKLATPDVSIADLIGDVDPIKAANLKLPYSDERVIHFGLVPRANRSIFVINELPDLQARIQVSLFNILQEGDLQIRGFKFRLPLDIQFIFTANPEDYTNRGSIITPLKDRIESQILTHYPMNIDIAKRITEQEAKIDFDQFELVQVQEVTKDILERVSFGARESDYIDEKSGVSARLSISAYENLISAAERRAILNGDNQTNVRLNDFWGIIPAITGKVELVYEGEQEGPYNVALSLIQDAIEEEFIAVFPDPEKNNSEKDPYGTIRAWFSDGNTVELNLNDSNKEYQKALDSVHGLKKLAEKYAPKDVDIYFYMEFILHGMAACESLTQEFIKNKMSFSDPFSDFLEDLGGLT